MKKLFVLLASIMICQSAQAQVLLSDFSDLSDQIFSLSPLNSYLGGSPPVDQFVQNSGFASITSVNGGNPDGSGSFLSVFQGSTPSSYSSVDVTGLTQLQLTARLDTGNQSLEFTVTVFDNSGTEIGAAEFLSSNLSSSFSTVSSSFVLSGGGNAANATFFQFTGDGLSSDGVRVSLDNLAAVPEPSTFLLGGLGLAFIGILYGRRSARKFV